MSRTLDLRLRALPLQLRLPFHFPCDLQSRTSWATDVLGRELEIHYYADHRVMASSDCGGEHYAIELDDNGNMTDL